MSIARLIEQQEVLDWCRARLEEEPTVTAQVLREEAIERWPEMEGYTVRQFHARYPLQVKRHIAEGVTYPLSEWVEKQERELEAWQEGRRRAGLFPLPPYGSEREQLDLFAPAGR